MDKLNFLNIIKSFFLGAFIGVVLQVNILDTMTIEERIIMILVSASIGFIIGFVTEAITMVLPISIAKPWTYFTINGIISLVITGVILYLTVFISSGEQAGTYDLSLVIGIALTIVLLANIIDFLLYQRVQLNLNKYKSKLNKQLIQD